MKKLNRPWILLLGLVLFAGAPALADRPAQDDPDAVVVDGRSPAEPVLFRNGYVVPEGKRLRIEDITILCRFLAPADQEIASAGMSASASLRISYPLEHCPEEVTNPDICPDQRYGVGEATTRVSVAMVNGREFGIAYAGRRTAIYAGPFATLTGSCNVESPEGFPASISVGQGWLEDLP